MYGDSGSYFFSALALLWGFLCVFLGIRKSALLPDALFKLTPITPRETVLILCLALLSLLLRIWQVDQIPYGINNDEAVDGLLGIAQLHHAHFEITKIQRSFLSYYYVAALFKLFGANLFTLRLSGALCGVVEVLSVFGIARRLWSLPVAYCAAILCACAPIDLSYARTGIACIHPMMLLLPGIYLLLKGWQEGKLFMLIISGVCISGSALLYYSTRFVVPIMLIFTLVFGIGSSQFKTKRLIQIITWAFFVIAGFTPFLIQFKSRGLSIISRERTVLMEGFNRAEGSTFIEQLISFGINNILAGLDKLFLHIGRDMITTYGGGMIISPENVFFLAGVSILLITLRRKESWFLIAAFFLGILPGLASVPAPRRMLLAIPFAHIIAALGFCTLTILLAEIFKKKQVQNAIFITGIALLTGVSALISTMRYFEIGIGNTQSVTQRSIAEYITRQLNSGQSDHYFVISDYVGGSQVYKFLLFYSTRSTQSFARWLGGDSVPGPYVTWNLDKGLPPLPGWARKVTIIDLMKSPKLPKIVSLAGLNGHSDASIETISSERVPKVQFTAITFEVESKE